MKKILSAGMVVFVIGCSNGHTMLVDYSNEEAAEIQRTEPSEGFKALEAAPICCQSLQEIDYQKIESPGKQDFAITSDSQAFAFATGKSFVKGFELPPAAGRIQLQISAPIITNVFVPSLLVLDDAYQPVQLIDEKQIRYEKRSLITVDRYYAEVELSPSSQEGRAAKYLLVFSKASAMAGKTKLAQPHMYATKSGRVDVNMRVHQNEPVPHTAVGAIRLALDYAPVISEQQVQSVLADQPVAPPAETDASSVLAPAPAATPTPTPAPKAVSKPAPEKPVATADTIQPEVDAMFAQLIEQAVREGNYQKAIRIVEDAEQAGSTTARDTLIEAMKDNL